MTRLWVRLWWYTRKRALRALREKFPGEYSDAHRAWARGARLDEPLDTPAWNTRGLVDDLALHDAADSLLGEQA